LRSAGFVRRLALDLRVVARELAELAAAEAEAAAARRSGSGIALRVVGEGRSVGSEAGSEVGSEDIVFFLSFLWIFVLLLSLFCELSSWFFCGDVVHDLEGYGLLLGVGFVMLG
jgi:hypothetical protein